MIRILAFLLSLGLAGCAGQTAQQTTAVTIYDVQQSLLGAQKVALTYLSQPPCTTTIAVTCVDPAVKATIKTASAAATSTMDAAVAANAGTGSPKLVAAAAAVAAFTAIIPTTN